VFRPPRAQDARAVFDLVKASPPLDPNSLYCNLLQCTHFAATCLIAERGGKVVGWVSAYRPPDAPDTLFVWQIAVDAAARGEGLGGSLLDRLLHLPAVRGVSRIATTVTPSNHASRRMFAGLARRHGLEADVHPWFGAAVHFGGTHESEELISIGPLPQAGTPLRPAF